jgi:RNA polymerase sigma-70 factor (ECF subfamily)
VARAPRRLDLALQRARDGDARGFDELYRAHAAAVTGYLRARNVSDPDDLTNEVFLRAFRTVHTVQGDASRFRSWLFGIARNAAIDEARHRRRQPVGQSVDTDRAGAGGDVEDEALRRVESDLVRALLESLAPDQRDVLLLRIVGDLSVAQTAAVVDKSYEAVKALQRRGLAALRRTLQVREGVPQ